MISVCIIVRNESKNIRECLSRIKQYGFEIIVVDTGSTDDTKATALQFTDKVYDFKWCDDFSAARNFSISKANNDHILVIDSDEFIREIDIEDLRTALDNNSDLVGRIEICNIFSRGNEQMRVSERINRVFRKSLFCYKGRIHEQIVAKDGSEYSTYYAPIKVEHIGYDGDPQDIKKKTQRNIELLLMDEKENGKDPYILYQLGKSYYMQNDYFKACEYFAQGLEFDVDPKLEYVIDMVETYGYALVNSKQHEVALSFENIYDVFGNRAEFKFLMGLIYMNNAMFEKAVQEFLKAVKYKECSIEGVNSYKAYYNIGVIYECLGELDEAKAFYAKSGMYEKARERLKVLEKQE